MADTDSVVAAPAGLVLSNAGPATMGFYAVEVRIGTALVEV